MGVALEKLCRERHDGDGQDEQRENGLWQCSARLCEARLFVLSAGVLALTRSVHPHATRHTGSLISFIHAQYLKRVVANVGV
jgi:hypothetical protein